MQENSMPEKMKIGLCGSLGQMCSSVLKLILENDNYQIKALYEPLKKVQKEDYIEHGGQIIYHSNDINVLTDADIILDFSHDNVTSVLVDFAVSNKKKLIIGTTRLSDATLAKINEASKKIAIFCSPNMSFGINFLLSVINIFARNLKDYDIEIIEKHHRRKKDAPSGTALKFFETLKKENPDLYTVYDRTKNDSARKKDEVGISSIRGGGEVGTHTVLFASDFDEIELTHRMNSREALAQGALVVIDFISSKDKGFFEYSDIINIK